MRCKIVEPTYVAQFYVVNQKKKKKFRFYIILVVNPCNARKSLILYDFFLFYFLSKNKN